MLKFFWSSVCLYSWFRNLLRRHVVFELHDDADKIFAVRFVAHVLDAFHLFLHMELRNGLHQFRLVDLVRDFRDHDVELLAALSARQSPPWPAE